MPLDIDDDDIGEWVCLSWEDLRADLADVEKTAVLPHRSTSEVVSLGAKLPAQLQKKSTMTESTKTEFADALLTQCQALHGVETQLQAVLGELNALQFDSALLVASVLHGPLHPPQTPEGFQILSRHHAAKAFAPSATPVALTTLEFQEPGGATSLVDYQQRLASMPSVCVVERIVRFCISELDRHQDEKDIGRDTLAVNGVMPAGVQGYQASVRFLADALRSAVYTQPWQQEKEEQAAQLVLGALNRTSSGSAVFEEVMRIFHCPDVVIVSPESLAAQPLEAIALDGVFLCRAQLSYSIRDINAIDDGPLVIVDATFSFRVELSVLYDLLEPDALGVWPTEELRAVVLLSSRT